MPSTRNAAPAPEPEEHPEEPTDAERRRIQEEIRQGGTTGHNRWQRATVGSISYVPPEQIRTKTETFRAGQLMIDDRYNREIKFSWVDEIASTFNPDQLQVLNVSRRLYRFVQRPSGPPVEEQVFDGNLAAANRVEVVVISGQHRLLATLKAKGELFELVCNVYDGLTFQQESELFALFDEKVRPHQAYQRHRAHLAGGNPEAVAIERIANEIGMQVHKGKTTNSDGIIYAVSTLYSIARNNGHDFLRRVLAVHYGAWQEQKEGYTAPLLQGTAALMRKFGLYALWRDEWLMLALKDPAHNALSLRHRAQGAATGISATSIAQEVARIEHIWYQMGKKGYNRLPPWNSTRVEIEQASQVAMESRGKTGGSGGGRRPEEESA